MLDPALACKLQSAFGKKIELGNIERVVGQAEIRGERARLASSLTVLLLSCRQPGSPRHILAEHLFQVETVAIDRQIDGRLVAVAIGKGAGEFGVAQSAAGICELEVAAAERGIGGKREGTDAGLRRDVAVAGSPACERAELRAFKLD